MPFVSFADVEKLLPEGLRGVLRREPSTFVQLESFAAIIVRDVTGRAIPSEVEEPKTSATDWTVVPMAWIIAHAGLPLWQPPELVQRVVEANYAKAMTVLSEHRKASSTTALPEIKKITGEVTW